MHKEATIRRIGNSAGTTIPKGMLERQGLQVGDPIYIVETEQGLLITPYDPSFSEAMALYQEANKTYRNALHELAK